MNLNPLISIIVPNYNHSVFINQRLETIFNQTFQDFEVILLDDASTDDSVEFLRQYANHPKISHFIINKTNSGSPFRQWEKGIDLAKGKYIWIAESDDYCELEFLKKIIAFIQESTKELGVVYTQTVDVNAQGQLIKNRITWTSEFSPNIWKGNFSMAGDKFIKKYLKIKNVIPNASAVIFKRSLVKDFIFSNKMLDMKMCGDWWFWCQIIQNTNVGFLGQNLNYFRNHNSITRHHKTTDLKKQRLIEESYIRKKLSKKSVFQHKEKKKLYQSWYYLHSFREIFNWRFYKVVIDKSDYIRFLKSFVKFKSLPQ